MQDCSALTLNYTNYYLFDFFTKTSIYIFKKCIIKFLHYQFKNYKVLKNMMQEEKCRIIFYYYLNDILDKYNLQIEDDAY